MNETEDSTAEAERSGGAAEAERSGGAAEAERSGGAAEAERSGGAAEAEMKPRMNLAVRPRSVSTGDERGPTAEPQAHTREATMLPAASYSRAKYSLLFSSTTAKYPEVPTAIHEVAAPPHPVRRVPPNKNTGD